MLPARLLIAAAAVLTGCDAGTPKDATHDTGAPVVLLGANVSPSKPLAPGSPIELAFDRLLLPSAVTRQTFQLQDLQGNFLEPVPSYDPVSRVVRLCIQGLQPDQSYRITIAAPGDGGDPNGLRAIDGALLDPAQGGVCAASSLPDCVVEFPVQSGTVYTGVDACSNGTPVDFCKDVYPVIAGSAQAPGACSGGGCHSGSDPAAGLALNTTAGIRATAINRVAQGSNTGSRSATHAAARPFGVDMPIVDPASAPGDSWLIYKLLLAPPAGAATPTQRLAVPWNIVSDDERATLADWIPGREMPYPTDPSAPPGTTGHALTADQMETISLWILQGAPVPDCPP